MRTCKRNKQQMYYSLPGTTIAEYVYDDNGNKVVDYVDSEGVTHYLETGESVQGYGSPVLFYASISSELNELHMRAYGVDASAIYSEIVVDKGEHPDWVIGTIIWRTSDISYEDEDETIVKSNSSDYTIVGLMDEGLNEDWYLLRRNNIDKED